MDKQTNAIKTLLIAATLIIFSFTNANAQSGIIGHPIKIGRLMIAERYFQYRMNWFDAKDACAKLGKGWRLPTLEELRLMCDKRDEIGRYAEGFFWTCDSPSLGSGHMYVIQFIGGGDGYCAWQFAARNSRQYVRAVRTF